MSLKAIIILSSDFFIQWQCHNHRPRRRTRKTMAVFSINAHRSMVKPGEVAPILRISADVRMARLKVLSDYY